MINYGKQSIDQEDINSVKSVLEGDWLTQGPNIETFENSLKSYFKSDYACAVSNGTAALHLAGLALGWSENDIVITSPLTFLASVNAIIYCGDNNQEIKEIEHLSSENLKRVKIYKHKNWDHNSSQSPFFIETCQELKTIWHPNKV